MSEISDKIIGLDNEQKHEINNLIHKHLMSLSQFKSEEEEKIYEVYHNTTIKHYREMELDNPKKVYENIRTALVKTYIDMGLK